MKKIMIIVFNVLMVHVMLCMQDEIAELKKEKDRLIVMQTTYNINKSVLSEWQKKYGMNVNQEMDECEVDLSKIRQQIRNVTIAINQKTFAKFKQRFNEPDISSLYRACYFLVK